ncbi:MAG: ABC transporter ATP-binding protein [Pseudomonadota bacterium]
MTSLRVTGLEGGYTQADSILKGVDLAIAPGRIIAIIGPNGAGKSTLLKAIAGLIVITAGRITLDDIDITGASPRRVANLGIGFVPQEANIFGTLTVTENLDMGGWTAPANTRARIAETFERFPVLAEKRQQQARTLSGGQRQILAMAIALMTEPKLLLLDEPSAGLSPKAAAELFDTVAAIRANGVGIAMVEQNAVAALERADDASLLVDGRNAKTGSARSFLDDPELRHLFLGAAVPA